MSGLQKTLVLLALAVFCGRALLIGATFNHTFDEPTQIASGLELWQFGTFFLHADVPPAAKLLISAPAYVSGVRLVGPIQRGDWHAANELLYGSGRYWFVLRSARAVNTAIGAMLLLTLAWFAWRAFGTWPAVTAAWVAACSPGLVSAATIANSDVLGVLTVLWTFYAFHRLLMTRTLRDAAMAAGAMGVALATKLSAVPFFIFGLPVIAVFTCGAEIVRPFRDPMPFIRRTVALLIPFVVLVPAIIWASYGFHRAAPIGAEQASQIGGRLAARHPELAAAVERLPSVRIPLGDFARGVGVGYTIAHQGHPAYLMGQYSLHGWPYYFLVTLALKVPIGTWVAIVFSILLAVSAWRTPAGWIVLACVALALAVLSSVAGAGVNAGHRHIVVVEALFALIVAGGVGLALTGRSARRLVSAVVIAAAAGAGASLVAGVDALGYTNAFAGAQPDWWFVDSNLDWGQDLERLRAELQRRGVTEPIHLSYFGTADPARHGIAFVPLTPNEQTCGWIAVSAEHYRGLEGAAIGTLPPESVRHGYDWLSAQRVASRIGTSMRLYDVPSIRGVCDRPASVSAGAARPPR